MEAGVGRKPSEQLHELAVLKEVETLELDAFFLHEGGEGFAEGFELFEVVGYGGLGGFG